MAITESDVGAWVLRANPKIWDVHGAGERDEDLSGFRLVRNYRAELMRAGDRVLLWSAPDRSRKLEAGFYAEAVVDGSPFLEQGGGDHWMDETERQKLRPYVPLRDTTWWKSPLLRSDLVDLVQAFEWGRAPQMGNPTYVTPEQLEDIDARR